MTDVRYILKLCPNCGRLNLTEDDMSLVSENCVECGHVLPLEGEIPKVNLKQEGEKKMEKPEKKCGLSFDGKGLVVVELESGGTFCYPNVVANYTCPKCGEAILDDVESEGFDGYRCPKCGHEEEKKGFVPVFDKSVVTDELVEKIKSAVENKEDLYKFVSVLSKQWASEIKKMNDPTEEAKAELGSAPTGIPFGPCARYLGPHTSADEALSKCGELLSDGKEDEDEPTALAYSELPTPEEIEALNEISRDNDAKFADGERHLRKSVQGLCSDLLTEAHFLASKHPLPEISNGIPDKEHESAKHIIWIAETIYEAMSK